MKLSFPFVLIAASALLTGCGSLDNPFARLFHTGHDARVYNPQTGQFEWPEEKKPAKQRKSAAVAGALASMPAPQGRGDGRYFDAQKNQWIEQPPEDGAAPARRPKPAPRSPAIAGDAAGPLPTPGPTPLPARATGYYNTSTGKIEWTAGAAAAGAPTPAPKPAKHWWWPF